MKGSVRVYSCKERKPGLMLSSETNQVFAALDKIRYIVQVLKVGNDPR